MVLWVYVDGIQDRKYSYICHSSIEGREVDETNETFGVLILDVKESRQPLFHLFIKEAFSESSSTQELFFKALQKVMK